MISRCSYSLPSVGAQILEQEQKSHIIVCFEDFLHLMLYMKLFGLSCKVLFKKCIDNTQIVITKLETHLLCAFCVMYILSSDPKQDQIFFREILTVAQDIGQVAWKVSGYILSSCSLHLISGQHIER